MEKLIGKIENILFAAGEGMEISVLAQYLGLTEEELTELIEKENEKRLYEYSLIIKRTENKLRLCTRPEFAEDIYELLGKKSEEELTQAMLETLSIVAYKQPVTRQEIEEIRGVNSSYIMNSLLERGFIKEAGRKQVLGRPILYATDEAFLRHFGISELCELPELPKSEKEKIDV